MINDLPDAVGQTKRLRHFLAPQRIEESLRSIIFWGELSVEDLRDFFNYYQDNFSWIGEGKCNTNSFEKELKDY